MEKQELEEDMVLVPRAVVASACHAILMGRHAPETLELLRHYAKQKSTAEKCPSHGLEVCAMCWWPPRKVCDCNQGRLPCNCK